MNVRNPIQLLLNENEIFQPSLSNGKRTINISELCGNLAYHAMMLEAHLTPKAGLVDCLSNGAHSDMDIDTFTSSAEVLRPFMTSFVVTGFNNHALSASELLGDLRVVGVAAEKAMFTATKGINTHKGMIFTLGLICGAVGWLYRNALPFNAKHIRTVIIEACSTLVTQELSLVRRKPESAGEKIYAKYGLTGIRGEAAQGYPTIFDYSLPCYQSAIACGQSEEQALSQALLVLMAHNCDTNLINRGGIAGLKYVQHYAKQLANTVVSTAPEFEQHIQEFDECLIERNLSPGGSADLLAATWLLSQLNLCSSIAK